MRSKPAVTSLELCVSLLAGLILAWHTAPPPLICAVLCLVFACLAAVFLHRSRGFSLNQPERRLFKIFLCLAVLCLGAVRVGIPSVIETPANDASRLTGESVSFSGYVSAPPTRTASRTSVRVLLDEDQAVSGKVLLVFYSDPGMEFEYGDRVSASGTLKQPSDSGSGFSYGDYLEKDGIGALINNPAAEKLPGTAGSAWLRKLFRLRSALINRVYDLFPKPENALMAGILLGDETRIPSDVERAFERTGTSHIIAISGANFTLLVWLLTALLRRFMPRRLTVIPMVVFVFLYAVLVGWSAAVVRAAFMCAGMLLAGSFGRKVSGVSSLAGTAALMCMAQPAYLTDVGFQLSVCATLGILLFSDPLRTAVDRLLAKLFPRMTEGTRETVVAILDELCLMSICAQVFTVWISAKSFGQISLISLPANMLIAPFQPLIMLGGFLSLILSFVFRPLGTLAAKLIWPAPALTIRLVELCGDCEWASVYVEVPEWAAWFIIGGIVLVWSCRHQLAKYSPRKNLPPYVSAALFFGCIVMWMNTSDRRDHSLRIEVTAAAERTSLKLRTPGGRSLLIADGQTNYSARDLMDRRLFTAKSSPAAAWIDFEAEWMRDLFRTSNEAAAIDLLYAGGRDGDGAPLAAGDSFEADGVTVTCASTWLDRRAWAVSCRDRVILFPNGIPPERIFTPGGLSAESVSLTVLGAKDDIPLWEGYTAASVSSANISVDEDGVIRQEINY